MGCLSLCFCVQAFCMKSQKHKVRTTAEGEKANKVRPYRFKLQNNSSKLQPQHFHFTVHAVLKSLWSEYLGKQCN